MSLNGSLETAGDTDWFCISVVAGLAYQFTLTPTVSLVSYRNTDLNETLVDNASNFITGGSSNRVITYTPNSTEVLYLVVASGGNATGNYVISSSTIDEYSADINTSGSLAIDGNPTSGSLQTTADHDYLKMMLVGGSTYKFDVAAASMFSGSGLSERILDSNLVTVINGDSSTFGDRNYSFTYTPTASGTFYLDVYSGSSGTGSYAVTASTIGNPVYRFFDKIYGSQFLTSSSSERDTIISTRPDLSYEGVGLQAATTADAKASPVYRFFDTHYGTHFYTANAGERDTIQSTRTDLTYEGTGFSEYLAQQANSTAVYRFFDSNRGTHFFTANATERATIITTRSDLIPEGIAFYAPTT